MRRVCLLLLACAACHGAAEQTPTDAGPDGQPAGLRATGHDQESPFMASLFPQATQPPSLHATIYREYVLAPDEDALQLNLTIQNDGDQALTINKPYIGMAMNRGLR